MCRAGFLQSVGLVEDQLLLRDRTPAFVLSESFVEKTETHRLSKVSCSEFEMRPPSFTAADGSPKPPLPSVDGGQAAV